MLEFQNVSFTYPGADGPIMKNLSFQVEAGSFVSIIGASGSGKSTLFRLLNSLEEIQTGTITVNGTDIRKLSHYTSYMPQQDLLFPWRTVEKNVMLPMQVQKVPKEIQKKTAGEMLQRVGLSDWAKAFPRELSGGMRQRVSFARTLCAGSNLLLLDEPFSALDSITRISLQEWLREQWDSLDKTILFITHDVEEAIFLSEKILVLTGQPVTGLKEFTVPLPEKRNRDMLLQRDIQELKETLVGILRSEAGE